MKIAAMNAKVGSVDDLEKEGYLYEPKLDGYRALCYVNGSIQLISRNDLDLTTKYPELDFRKNIKAKSCILDGEIVAFNKKGVSSFQALQQGEPAHFMVFDILMKDGKSLVKEPLEERKKILSKTVRNGKAITRVEFTRDGKKLWKEVKKGLFEGVMAKKEAGLYHPGLRSGVWLKIKQFKTVDCVIVGFSQKKRLISSLAVALYNHENKLEYIGNVGTGYTEELLEQLYDLLTPHTTTQKPIINEAPRDLQWVKPKFVCEVKYAEVTQGGKLRVPVFVRLRPDKKSKSCTISDQL